MSLVATARRPAARPWLGFPAALRFLLLGDLVTAFGAGLTQPYLVILLHSVKGLPLVTATAMTSLLALASVPGNWLSGGMADRIGGYRTMTAGLAVTAGGLLLVSSGSGVAVLGAGVAAVGFGWSVTMPAYSTLIARLVSGGARSRAFTARYALFNVGMGLGAASGALMMAAGTLTLMWWLAAATCLVAIVTVWLARARDPGGLVAAPDADHPAGGYRRVFADRSLLRVLLATLLFATAGYGVYAAGLPILAIDWGAPQAMGAVSIANCLTVVAGLPFALAVTKRFRPLQLLALTTLLWSAGWTLCAVQAQTGVIGGRTALVAAAALMGLGEITLAGALPALVNALAPEELRGRYNAVLTLATTAGLWAGPVLTAAAAARHAVPAVFVVAVVLLAVAPAVARHPAAPGNTGTAGTRDPERADAGRPAGLPRPVGVAS